MLIKEDWQKTAALLEAKRLLTDGFTQTQLAHCARL
jgi:hypothetical protein